MISNTLKFKTGNRVGYNAVLSELISSFELQRSLTLKWDISWVLSCLQKASYQPLHKVSKLHVTIKTAFVARAEGSLVSLSYGKAVVCLFSNVISSGTTGPIEVKFHVEPPWDGGKKVCIWGPGHLTKVAAMPIYGKNPSKIFFSGTTGPICMKLGM